MTTNVQPKLKKGDIIQINDKNLKNPFFIVQNTSKSSISFTQATFTSTRICGTKQKQFDAHSLRFIMLGILVFALLFLFFLLHQW